MNDKMFDNAENHDNDNKRKDISEAERIYAIYCDYRDNGNFTDYQISKHTGIAQSTLSQWRTRVPSTASLQKVADFFGISIEVFLTPGKAQSAESVMGSDPRRNLARIRTLSDEALDVAYSYDSCSDIHSRYVAMVALYMD